MTLSRHCPVDPPAKACWPWPPPHPLSNQRLQATPPVVWRDETGALQARTGVTPRTLYEAMGPR